MQIVGYINTNTSYYSCPILTKLEFHRQVTAKNPLPKISRHYPMSAEYFDADRQPNMTRLKAALRKVLRTHLNMTSPRHESLLTSRRHHRRTDNIQRRWAPVTRCPTYSLGLSIEVRRYECVKTYKNSLCRITRAIKM